MPLPKRYITSSSKDYRKKQVLAFLQAFTLGAGTPPNEKDMRTWGYPSFRALQQQFGGILSLREEAGLDQKDLRSSRKRKELGAILNLDLQAFKSNLEEKILKKHPAVFIQRNHSFYDEGGTVDFVVSSEKSKIIIEILQPSSMKSLRNGLRNKKNKISSWSLPDHNVKRVLYISTNPEFVTEEVMDVQKFLEIV